MVVFNLGYCFWRTFSIAKEANGKYYYSLAGHIVCHDSDFASHAVKSFISVVCQQQSYKIGGIEHGFEFKQKKPKKCSLYLNLLT